MTKREELAKLLGREPAIESTPEGGYFVVYFNWNDAKSHLIGSTEDEAIELTLESIRRRRHETVHPG